MLIFAAAVFAERLIVAIAVILLVILFLMLGG
jgi:hypothetical protein